MVLWAEEPAPSPFFSAVQHAGARLSQGGFVAAEIDGKDCRFTSSGKTGVSVEPAKVIFEIGSVTKVFTGLLLAQSVLDGQVKLEDSVSKYLPSSVRLDPSVAAITLEQLATHTSGLPSVPDNMPSADRLNPYADYTVEQMYEFLSSCRLEAPAPCPASYSNLGFGLLGHILALVHHKSFAELVAERITRPLGMSDTCLVLDHEQQARFAPPHDGPRRAEPWTLPTLAGAGALRSTAADMAKFMQALMAADEPLKAAWELAREPRADFGSEKIGLAIGPSSRAGRTWYSHNGGTGGYRAHIEFCPETKHGYVLLLNNTAPEPATIVSQLRAVPLDPNRGEVPIDPAKLADYVGVYRVGAQFEFTVIVGPEKRLLVRMSHQNYGPPLFYAGADRFFSRRVSADFQFGRSDRWQSRIDHLNPKRTANDRAPTQRRVSTPLRSTGQSTPLASWRPTVEGRLRPTILQFSASSVFSAVKIRTVKREGAKTD